jgi:hypothetical protein
MGFNSAFKGLKKLQLIHCLKFWKVGEPEVFLSDVKE